MGEGREGRRGRGGKGERVGGREGRRGDKDHYNQGLVLSAVLCTVPCRGRREEGLLYQWKYGYQTESAPHLVHTTYTNLTERTPLHTPCTCTCKYLLLYFLWKSSIADKQLRKTISLVSFPNIAIAESYSTDSKHVHVQWTHTHTQ